MSANALGNRRILIIEDEPVIAVDLEAAVSEAGGEAVIASTIEQAQDELKLNRIDGAIVDMKLQGQSVRDLVDVLVERGTPFVIYTGMEDTPTVRRLPAVPVITKPAAPATIVDCLTRSMV
ncbi:MAG: response regulator [Hyphomicrobiaceae bacterium]